MFIDKLYKFWLYFGKTPKDGATNFAAVLGGIATVGGSAITTGKLDIEWAGWFIILASIGTVINGLAGGRSADLDHLQ